MKPSRRIVLDGTEGREGRALLLLSALSHCAADLAGDQLRFVDVSDAAVCAGIELLKWETGLDVEVATQENTPPRGSIFAKANLYAAILFRDKTHLHLTEATSFNVPTFVAFQFPQSNQFNPESVSLMRAAHDPEYFASRLTAMLGSI